ncbi:MAG: acyl-CoA/acyl-ACP dehydrogenase [Deltaproteobacteria bacterium]|nr:acyl-CoA/acyl-ACP dehydrogenase [Deltaproteobacteria bacterium]MBW2447636.1 acyl-CoA/acyl-ACP dehydrogenase [Deltaproteobacteria bacterium]
MNFDFSEDQKLVQKTARDYLDEQSGLDVCRAVLESGKPYDTDLWKGIAEMGWLGVAVDEVHGGAGMGYLELVLIAEEVGRALAPIPFASSVYLCTEAIQRFGSPEQQKKYLPRLAAGEVIGTGAFFEGPGDLDASTIELKLQDGKLDGEKWPVPDGDVAGLAVALAQDGQGRLSMVLVDLEGDGVTKTSLGSIDPSRSQAKLRFEAAPAEVLGEAGHGWDQTEALLDRAALLLAFEQIGGAERALEITKEQTMGRYAFGRPVASFQAIKHRMADLYCAIEIARSNAYYGAYALSNDLAEELAVAAPSARSAASDAFDLAGQEMIQFHGGVGFTWEYDCHLFYRRAKALSVALGSPAAWREKLVARLEAREAQ